MSRQQIAIITPLYNEAENIQPFYEAAKNAVAKLPYDCTIYFVDDGSTDDSAKEVDKLPKKPLGIELVRLSRNFGKEAALSAGLATVKGDAAILIDTDLQHPIELIPEFIAEWVHGAEVVVGVRRDAGDKRWFKRLTSRVFYGILNKISDIEIIPHATDYRLVSREVIDAYNGLTERNRMTRGLIDWLGYDRAFLYFDAKERRFGTPKYSYRKLTRLALDSFVAYSFFPLRLAGYLGGGIMVISTLLGVFVLVEAFVMDDPMNLNITGTGLLALTILFLVGVILACLGLFGLYIASIYDETTNRPLYVIRKNNKSS